MWPKSTENCQIWPLIVTILWVARFDNFLLNGHILQKIVKSGHYRIVKSNHNAWSDLTQICQIWPLKMKYLATGFPSYFCYSALFSGSSMLPLRMKLVACFSIAAISARISSVLGII